MNRNGKVIYDRRVNGLIERASLPEAIFPNWQGDRECWMFLSAHDDDIVTGAGLTLLAALDAKINTHAVITANGSMGYCRPEHRNSIAAVRQKEAKASFKALGLPARHLHFLGFEDCSLYLNAGRRFEEDTYAPRAETTILGATGLQNSFTWILRKVRPTRLFIPNPCDIHPDHQLTAKEMLISIFHAQGGIWPELGPKLEEIPMLYEYAAYSDFTTPPTIRVRTTPKMLDKKLDGIKAYASQEQIDLLIDIQRESGPQEYLREVEFDIMTPHKYDHLFD